MGAKWLDFHNISFEELTSENGIYVQKILWWYPFDMVENTWKICWAQQILYGVCELKTQKTLQCEWLHRFEYK